MPYLSYPFCSSPGYVTWFPVYLSLVHFLPPIPATKTPNLRTQNPTLTTMSVKTHHSTWIRIHVLELQITGGNRLCKDAHHLSHETKSQGVLGNALEQHRALHSHLACGRDTLRQRRQKDYQKNGRGITVRFRCVAGCKLASKLARIANSGGDSRFDVRHPP